MVSWDRGAANNNRPQALFDSTQPPKITTQRKNMQEKKKSSTGRRKTEDLSHDDLLFLLSILEGELQVEQFKTKAKQCDFNKTV